uniref:Peptidase metallopeptidase domain-containing protein n=1 Tax=Romanomermis culicivorax TaxID=13658 RepID=A0A915JI01_ROMCU
MAKRMGGNIVPLGNSKRQKLDDRINSNEKASVQDRVESLEQRIESVERMVQKSVGWFFNFPTDTYKIDIKSTAEQKQQEIRRFISEKMAMVDEEVGSQVKAIGSFAIFPERVKRKFIDYAPSKWQTEFPIQYSFDGTHSKDTTIHWSKFESCSNIGRKQKQMIRLALTYWRNTTCLEFEERQDQPQTDRIVFTRNGGSCTSEVGILVHEISHALGFYHEQTRSPKQVVHLRIIGSKFQTYCDMDHLLCMDYVEIRNSSADLAGTGMR